MVELGQAGTGVLRLGSCFSYCSIMVHMADTSGQIIHMDANCSGFIFRCTEVVLYGTGTAEGH